MKLVVVLSLLVFVQLALRVEANHCGAVMCAFTSSCSSGQAFCWDHASGALAGLECPGVAKRVATTYWRCYDTMSNCGLFSEVGALAPCLGK